MTRPCSGECCPLNAETCKCTGIEGCEWYTPKFDELDILISLLLVAAVHGKDVKTMLQDAINKVDAVIKE